MAKIPQPKLKILLLLAGLSIVLLAVTVYGMEETSKPSFCQNCHVMKPAFQAWTESSHKSVSCMKCHADYGVQGKLKAKLGGLRQVWVLATEDVKAEEIVAEVPNKRCLTCHEADLPWLYKNKKAPQKGEDHKPVSGAPSPENSESLTVIAEHQRHVEGKSLSCTTCHDRVVHAPGGKQAWQERMDTCISCHQKENVKISKADATVTCAQCHDNVKEIQPQDHKVAWRQKHGPAAKQSESTCNTCHRRSDGSVPAIQFAASSENPDFCLKCHGTPIPHEQDWLAKHGKEFESNSATCTKCHGDESPDFQSTVTVTVEQVLESKQCSGCHQTRIPHPENWRTTHKVEAKAKPASCNTCHSSANPNSTAAYAKNTFCSDCHTRQSPHKTKWKSEHRDVVKAQGNSSCLTCHKEWAPKPVAKVNVGLYCNDCHTKQNPHPADWVASGHQPVVISQGTESCRSCHERWAQPSVQPPAQPPVGEQQGLQQFCSRCHSPGPGHDDQYWFIKHSKVVEEQGLEACNRCHSQQNFCSRCHSRSR